MDGAICTSEGIHGANYAYHERETLSRPVTGIQKGPKNFRRRLMWSEDCQWEKYGEEAQNVENKDKALKLG